MFNPIERYLHRYRAMVNKNTIDRETVIRVLREELSIEIPEEVSIRVKKGTLKISAHPAFHYAVFKYKDRIIARLNMHGINITDIT
jgi:hypothetical protein